MIDEGAHEGDGFGSGGDAGAVHAAVEVDEERDGLGTAGGSRVYKSSERALIIDEGRKLARGVGLDELKKAIHVRPDERVGNEDVGHPGEGGEFGLGDGGTLHRGDAEGELFGEDLVAFVGLDVRPQAGGIASDHLQHQFEVAGDGVRVKEQSGGGGSFESGDRFHDSVFDLEDDFDLDGDIPRQSVGRDGAAGSDTGIGSEDFGEEFRVAVHDLRLLGKVIR